MAHIRRTEPADLDSRSCAACRSPRPSPALLSEAIRDRRRCADFVQSAGAQWMATPPDPAGRNERRARGGKTVLCCLVLAGCAVRAPRYRPLGDVDAESLQLTMNRRLAHKGFAVAISRTRGRICGSDAFWRGIFPKWPRTRASARCASSAD